MGLTLPQYFFGLRMHERVAVDFRGGGEQKPGALVLGQSQRLVGAQRTDLRVWMGSSR